MLSAIRQLDSEKVLARDSTSVEAPFFCPRCRSELILRKGRIKVHHFAHKPDATCSFGAGETEQHLRAKLEIFDALRSAANVTELDVERDFGNCVADVFAIISGVPVAVEIQKSVLSVNNIIARTTNYHRLGVAVLWLALRKSNSDGRKYSPKAWEKWCHAAYFGRVYFWSHGQVIQPVHFGTYKLHVPATSWHQDGSEHSAGGYDKRSKRWHTLIPGIPTLLSNNFKQLQRAAWAGGSVSVPQCTLYIDKQDKWWRKDE